MLFFLTLSHHCSQSRIDKSTEHYRKLATHYPPEAVHIHDEFLPYISVTIDSKPISNNLPADSPKMAKQLNQYEVVYIQPNLNKLEWDSETDKYLGTPNNILTELDFYSRFLTRTTQLQKPFHTIKRVATDIAVAPIALVGFILLSPILVPFIRDEHEAKKSGLTALREKAKKEQEAQEIQLQKLLQQIFQETELKPAIETLIKNAKEHPLPITDLKLKTIQQNRYSVLPSRHYFTINMSDKRLIYSKSLKSLSIPIYFKAPYPRKEDVIENFKKSSVKFLPDSEIRFSITGNVRYLPEGFHEHIEITKCSINYKDNYAYKEVACSGIRTWR